MGLGNGNAKIGDKGSNWKYEFTVLKLLETIALNSSGAGGTQTVTSSLEVNSLNSPVPSGTSSVGFTTDSTFVGTINGVARNPSTFYGFSSANGKTLASIPFTVTAGSVVIDIIT